jgi:hypothetical protein
LVDFVNTTQQNSSPNQTITVCEKCKEDTHLRLSKLMENADEQFQDNVSTAETELADISAITLDDTPSTSQCNNISARSRIGFNQIFSSIRSPFSKMLVRYGLSAKMFSFLDQLRFLKVTKKANGMPSRATRPSYRHFTTRPKAPTLN